MAAIYAKERRRSRTCGTRYLLKRYLVSGRTVTIDGGVGRGSPFEKWMVARAINVATIRAKTAIRRTGIV
jgi:hypothetical protein